MIQYIIFQLTVLFTEIFNIHIFLRIVKDHNIYNVYHKFIAFIFMLASSFMLAFISYMVWYGYLHPTLTVRETFQHIIHG